ncbi:MAG: ABC transporter substrate-binding protein [Gammaproteobacteria bacterium]
MPSRARHRSAGPAVNGPPAPLATDPAALRSLAHRLLRPHLDVLFAGQVILGKWWGEASPDQRRRFAEALYGNLLRRHAPSLLLVTDGMVSIDDSPPPAAGAGEARLAVTVRVPGYAPVPVTLYFRRTGQHWRVFDARVEDFSPLLQLRNLFSAEIRDTGLAAVIRRLESENPPSASPGQRARQCLDRALGP